MCVFFLFLLVFFWKVSKEGTLVWCIITLLRSTLIFRWLFARRLILEICFPIYFWSSGEVVVWDSKMPSKNPVEPRRECLCEPGSSPKELPRRNRYFSPSRFRLGLGTKCTVWSCLLFSTCVIVISGLLGLCQLSCFGNKNLAASRLLRSATCCASNLGGLCSVFSFLLIFSRKSLFMGSASLQKREMKRSESLNSL